jgi:hypothetical protein
MPWKQSQSVQVYRAVDWGFFPDPAVCLWIAHLGNRYIVFKEMLEWRMVASEFAKKILEESEGMRISQTFCDPTMDINTGADIRTIKDTFEINGVPLECSVNNRAHYAHAVHTALQEEVIIRAADEDGPEIKVPRLQITRDCPYLIKTIPMMRFDEKKTLALADHKHDHAVVALAYFLISHGSMEHHRAAASKTTPRWMHPKAVDRYILGTENVRDRF